MFVAIGKRSSRHTRGRGCALQGTAIAKLLGGSYHATGVNCDMHKTPHMRATVQPGGKAEIASPELESGQTVDVTVRCSSSTERRSVVDILAEAPGHLVFRTAAEVKAYLSSEKEAWDR